ncbi:oxidoreductase [Isoptericola sp. 4D.3]|uniref:Oxidoreductase n=1 Tax=Isoptericola peretonis TaxID=2918523 RepID=A0ABT0J6X0_9MICO|nr:oxidoreductase [Isoptericola sp. 4D.3]
MSHWTPATIPDQTGRTALITGANSGVGLETARVLAGRGTRVLLAGRSGGRLAEAADAIRVTAPSAVLETVVVDLSNLESVREAAARVAQHETLDLLINNAGVMNLPERTTTADGFETTFGTNHLGHFALDAQVWPAVLRSRSPRVVTVSAIASRWPSGKLRDLQSEVRYRPMGAYAKSKRANVVYALELDRRAGAAGRDVTSVVVHPGAAMTGLQRYSGNRFAGVVTSLAERLLMGSPEGASWPSLYAATSEDADSGTFYGPAGRDQTAGAPTPAHLPPGAADPDLGARLWAESERLTGVTFSV